jgi:hypothetical protein
MLLSAFQKSYNVFSGKDTRQHLSQSKQPRSAATATVLPADNLKIGIANHTENIHQYAFIEI